MKRNKTPIDQVILEHTSYGGSRTWKYLANKYGYKDADTLYSAVKRLRRKARVSDFEDTAYSKAPEQVMSKKIDGDNMIVDVRGASVSTLDELVKFCEIDLEKDIILSHEVKKWAVPIKKVDKDKDGNQTTVVLRVPIFGISAKLRAKDPKHTLLPVQVITNVAQMRPKSIAVNENLVVVYSDTHIDFFRTREGRFPMHSRSTLKIIRMIMDDLGITESIHLGDLFDFAEHSKSFPKTQEFMFTTQAAMVEAAYWLDYLETKLVVEGNHDVRIRRAINDHYIAVGHLTRVDDLYGDPVTSIPHLLAFDRSGIKWIPDGHTPVAYTKDCYIMHGDRTYDAVRLWNMYSPYKTIFFGHLHRDASFCKTSPVGLRQVHAAGCCCDIKGMIPGHKQVQGWTQGFLIYDKASNRVEHILIENGKAYYRGKLYEADDEMDDKVIQDKLNKIFA